MGLMVMSWSGLRLSMEAASAWIALWRWITSVPETSRPHLANLTRNVEFSSESTQLDRRGHVMLMHTRDALDIANAAFRDLGRTDKLKVVDPPYFEEDGTFVEGTGTNQSGRYSVHFHRNGVDRLTAPARVSGSVVEGSG